MCKNFMLSWTIQKYVFNANQISKGVSLKFYYIPIYSQTVKQYYMIKLQGPNKGFAKNSEVE